MSSKLNRYSFKKFTCILIHIFFSMMLILSCGKKDGEISYDYTPETAKMIGMAPAELLAPDSKIAVKFVSDMIKPGQVGNILSEPVFSFEPEITGSAKWVDRQTLAFIPSKPMPMRQQYQAELDMAALFPRHEKENLALFKFSFTISGREISAVETDFETVKANAPKHVLLTGKISFTDPLQKNTLIKNTTLELDRKKIQFSIDGEDSGKIFFLRSETIVRTDKNQKIKLHIDADELEISQDFKKEIILTALQNLRVQQVDKIDMGNAPALKITFSDKLSQSQDITGLVNVAELTAVKLKKNGKTVFVSGEFDYGKSYELTVHQSVRSKMGTQLAEIYFEKISFEDIKPQMRFSSDGVFLPSGNLQQLNFQTINLKRVRLEIQQVYESNLGQFLQTEQLESRKQRNDYFNNYEMRRVGTSIYKQPLEIGTAKNTWQQHALDLSKIIPKNEHGLFVIKLNFEREDMIWDSPSDNNSGRYYGDDYYNNPASYGYIYRHGKIFKAVISSDLAITYKSAQNEKLVFVTDILSAAPVTGVTVELRSYQNQVLASAVTDGEGAAKFETDINTVFYVLAQKGSHRSILKMNEMAWNSSAFETGGAVASESGIRAFVYTERGVYRPGDSVHVSLIARNSDKTFAPNHPVTFKLYNPKNQLVLEEVNKNSSDGFYCFNFNTESSDPTGNYRAEFLVGSKTVNHTIKIETVVPHRLKVNIDPEKKILTATDKFLKLNVNSTYLFGNPAANLKTKVNVDISEHALKFKRFAGFSFANSARPFSPQNYMIYNGTLNAQGKRDVKWQIPAFGEISSALKMQIKAKVFEKGGRATDNDLSVIYYPFEQYVGLQTPDFEYGYARVGNNVDVPVILVDRYGKALAGRQLNYKIYKNERYWWWEYNNRRDFHLRYKSDANTALVSEGTIDTKNTPAIFKFTPEDWGEYLVEVSTGPGGHTAGFFMRAYHWGDAPAGSDPGLLTLNSDKKEYMPGETAKISFPTPAEGNILVTVEKADKILKHFWQKPDVVKNKTTLEIPVSREMLPNAYVTVSIIQKHEQTLNDRPIRMYGIVPLMVLDGNTRQKLEVNMPAELESGEKFSVELRNLDREQTQFSIAVVDEGLLSLTRFKTPDPWQYFYQKIKLSVASFDLFRHIIGANKGDIFRTFSIGGGLAEMYAQDQQQSQKSKRFKAVSLFKGPLTTDENGYAKIDFKMPEYIGAVRVMVVAANREKYGHLEKTVPVKKDIILLPTLPRVVGPGERFKLPVTVFTMNDQIKNVQLKLSVKGPVDVLDTSEVRQLTFKRAGEKDAYFEILALKEIGTAKFMLEGNAPGYSVKKEIELAVRPSSARIFSSETVKLERGQEIKMTIPGNGVKNSNRAVLKIGKKPKLNLENRLRWLMHYPYGCIEQTVSSVFPQLYLKEFIKPDGRTDRDIDHHINTAIHRLRKFQTASGGFGYWPGDREASQWGTSYAGHFLLEAKKLGYNVPASLLSNWQHFEKSQALAGSDSDRQQVYRLFLLALNGTPEIGAMNLLRESKLDKLKDTDKWLLAAAYKLAGVENTANNIARKAGFTVKEYWEFSYTYGSQLRDQAMILSALLVMNRIEDANKLYDLIAGHISSQDWYSTQTTGYSLLALGHYMQQNSKDFGPDGGKFVGKIEFPDGEKISFNTSELKFTTPIEKYFGEEVKIELLNNSDLDQVFVSLDWNGIPLLPEQTDLSKNLILDVEWLNEDGMKIDPANIKQGQTFYGHFSVSRDKNIRHSIEELALVQVLPSGWEIENTRLSGEDKPGWMRNWKTGREEYLDIRDDRIIWFFDIGRYDKQLDFVVKLNAITVGKYILPPTITEAMYHHKFQARQAGKWVTVGQK